MKLGKPAPPRPTIPASRIIFRNALGSIFKKSGEASLRQRQFSSPSVSITIQRPVLPDG